MESKGLEPAPVVAAVIVRAGRYLICQRPTGKRHAGLWEFPGGKLKPGEDFAAAARRELREELDVAVMSVGARLAAFDDADGRFRIVFFAVEIEGEPACLEHQALAWLHPAEMSGLPLAPSDRCFVDFLEADGPP